ncbi:MAG: site-specific DNA-methyltransferase, partial [bacterium]
MKVSVKELHQLVKAGKLKATTSASGQKRFDIKELERIEAELKSGRQEKEPLIWKEENILEINGTVQKVYIKSSR